MSPSSYSCSARPPPQPTPRPPCRALIADPARQDLVDDLVQAVGTGVRDWLKHREHVWCDECRNGGLPTFEQRVAKAIEDALTSRAEVDPGGTQ